MATAPPPITAVLPMPVLTYASRYASQHEALHGHYNAYLVPLPLPVVTHVYITS